MGCRRLVGSIIVVSWLMMLNQECLGRVYHQVSLDLYYESLCPFSANFIVQDLAPIFDNGLIDILDLNLFPWGNAKIRSHSSFACQHGPSECLLNTVQACVIDAKPAVSDHFPFIECVERLVHDRKYNQWETCLKDSNLDPDSVKECSSGKHGKELELKYAAATDALKPPHEYVPWVVVNGQPLYEDYDNFTSYVCKAFKGPLPRACRGKSSSKSLREKTLHSHPVCYADKPSRSWMSQLIMRFGSSHPEAI